MKRIALLISAIILATLFIFPGFAAPASAGGANCSANPDTVVVGSVINISCSGFTPNVIVNSYVVDDTGFAETGRSNYTGCLVGAHNNSSGSSKVNEAGVASYVWYTQNGVNTCPTNNYDGYANHLGAYTVVVQELDGKGNIAAIAKVEVRITGNGNTYSGATLWTDGPAVSGGTLTVYGAGFAGNEYVNIWFTRPANCSGLGDWYWTGVSAFSPSTWAGGGISGADSVKTDSAGNFTASYLLHDLSSSNPPNAFPCFGTWSVTANALGSGRGGEVTFGISGNAVSENAKVWTAEVSVPSNGQIHANCSPNCGIAVHAYGSGFPAGSHVNCWFTRPDGTVYHGYGIERYGTSAAPTVGADGTFSGLTLTYSSAGATQSDQPGTWAVTCGTPDGKYVGIAHFLVYALPFLDP